MYSMFGSTIAAISTPRGKGGIAVIRVSGDDAITICEKFIFPKSGKKLSEIRRGSVCLADVKDEDGGLLDEAVITVFHAPHSYTGENTVEISCHGGVLLTESILMRTLSCGAVQAGPGEFTRRAFSAGKLSLSQAEAVIGMIDAETKAALALSRINLDGAIRRKTDAIYDTLKTLVSGVYAIIDFPDEDLSSLSEDEVRDGIISAMDALEMLRRSYKTGHAVCEGVKTVIFGKPNTGKSTILNLLAEKERAIVTDVAGTTRDVISETVAAGNVTLRLSDTAGVHGTDDFVESIGVQKSIEALEEAELILAVFDLSRGLDAEDEEILTHVENRASLGVPVIAICNKSDLFDSEKTEADISRIATALGTEPILLCAKNETSREALVSRIETTFESSDFSASDNAVITNARQFAAVNDALSHVRSALETLDFLGADTACSELELAMGSLGEFDGRQVTIDIVDSIFHRFCVGK
ncbi:MAG: tRNA uridine-5-carboxymethylaminomethyl(34) synthesis GTPase MnmE [Clostridia bacterium]|nr:tRNA uridine-5-carboxymethylaminomethyl(34) synthesis GTPase MnmE [Clostridia bacterium]